MFRRKKVEQTTTEEKISIAVQKVNELNDKSVKELREGLIDKENLRRFSFIGAPPILPKDLNDEYDMIIFLRKFIMSLKKIKKNGFDNDIKKNVTKKLKTLIDFLETEVEKTEKELKYIDKSLKVAFLIPAYYSTKQNIEKYLNNNTKDSVRLKKFKDRLEKFKKQLGKAYQLAKDLNDKRTSSIKNIIDATDGIIDKSKDRFTEDTIKEIEKLGTELDKVPKPGRGQGDDLSRAQLGVKGMLDFVTFLVHRDSFNQAGGKEFIELCKQLEQYKHREPRIEGGLLAFLNDGTDPNKGRSFRNTPKDILENVTKVCVDLSKALSAIKEKFVNKSADWEAVFDDVIKQLETSSKEATLDNLEMLQEKYENFSTKLEDEKEDKAASTLLDYFKPVKESLDSCIKDLNEKLNVK